MIPDFPTQVKGTSMKRGHWMVLAAALVALAGSQAAVASTRADGAAAAVTYDISNPAMLPAYETCGHIAWRDYGSFEADWAVDGVVVAYDEYAINHTNDGSPYTVSIGQVSGGTFTAYYSETFYPQVYDDPFAACRSM
jgi:hypothetical protein